MHPRLQSGRPIALNVNQLKLICPSLSNPSISEWREAQEKDDKLKGYFQVLTNKEDNLETVKGVSYFKLLRPKPVFLKMLFATHSWIAGRFLVGREKFFLLITKILF